MSRLLLVREADVFHDGLRLMVEVEFYKTVAHVFIIDDALAYPLVDSYKVKVTSKGFDLTRILDDVRARAIEKGYFKDH